MRTNAIFSEAVQMSLDMEIDLLERGGEPFADRRLARIFGGDAGVARELRRLRELNAAALHFELGAYHHVLLYAVLPDQIEAMNDAHAGQELMTFCSGRYRVRRIRTRRSCVCDAVTREPSSRSVELTEAQEAALRRRHATAPATVWRELEAMGCLYQPSSPRCSTTSWDPKPKSS